jgi:SNF2 family DNA or RNA helicase
VLEARLAEAASRKRKAVLPLVEEHLLSGQKVVLFTGRKRDCDELGELVRKLPGVKQQNIPVWSAHGSQSPEERQDIVDDYMQNVGACALVGTGPAFGESLNLDDTDAAFFVMLPYTPGDLRQWEGRFHRASTKKSVLIYYTIAENTIDEHVASILIDKLPAVRDIANDDELADAAPFLSGDNPDETEEEMVQAILSCIDDY